MTCASVSIHPEGAGRCQAGFYLRFRACCCRLQAWRTDPVCPFSAQVPISRERAARVGDRAQPGRREPAPQASLRRVTASR